MKNKFVKIGSAVLGVSLLFLVPTLVSAFSTHEDFHLYCDENNTVAVIGHFTNNESTETLHVTVTDNASHITVDLGNVAPGQTIDKSGSTMLHSIGAGSVTVKAAKVSDESVYTTDTVNYSAFSCNDSYKVREDVTAACDSQNLLYVDMRVYNDETFPIKVIATNPLFLSPVDFGTISPGESILARYQLQQASVGTGSGADTVHFKVTKVDGSDSANINADIPDVSCFGVTPTVTPTDTPDSGNSDSGSDNGSNDNGGSNNTDPAPAQVQGADITTLPKTGTPFSDFLLLGSMFPAGLFLKKFAR